MRTIVSLVIASVLFFVVGGAQHDAFAAGALYLATAGGGGGAPSNQELPLERTDFDVDVAGAVVGATVTQRFTNTYKQPIEVVYAFPLPQRAAVDAMEMKIGQRVVTASIARRDEARTAYVQAVREGRRAALLEQERPNIFTFSVGNIDPGATIDVKLHYFEVAQYDHGVYEIALPTTIGPRFIPGDKIGGNSGNAQSGLGMKADTDRVPDASRISPGYQVNTGAKLGVHVRIDAGTGSADIDSVTSPLYPIDVAKPSTKVADVRLKNQAEIPNKDFVLQWRLAAGESFKPAIFTHRPKADEPGYLTLAIEPKHNVKDLEVAPRELFFVLDTSGSMHGAPLTAAINAVHRAIDGMNPNDTFQIIDFADRASTFAPTPLKNTPENRTRGHNYIAHLRSSGGTNQLVGIKAALTSPGEESRIRYVVFMTDGYIGNDAQVIALTRKEIGRARIFSFGVGRNVNRYLLDEVAIAGRGYAEYMDPNSTNPEVQQKELVDRFYRRISMPYLTEIEVDWGKLAVSDMRPFALPDLSALQPLVLHARYSGTGATEGDVAIRGRVGGKPFTQKIHVKLPAVEARNGAISRLWARETIAELERKPKGVPVDAVAITSIALQHSLLSKYTSFIATDSSGPKGNQAPLLVTQPNESPDGIDTGAAGGIVQGSNPATTRPEMNSPPAPSPRDHADVLTESSPHHGGCAGCTTTSSSSSSSTTVASLAALAGLALLVARRRRNPRNLS